MANCNALITSPCTTSTLSGNTNSTGVISQPGSTQSSHPSGGAPGIWSKRFFTLLNLTHQLFIGSNKCRSYPRTKSWNWGRKFCGSISGGLWVRCFSANKTRELNGLNRPDTMKIVYLWPFASRSPPKSTTEAKSRGMSLLNRTTLRQLGLRKLFNLSEIPEVHGTKLVVPRAMTL
jgi:hypothetical protein